MAAGASWVVRVRRGGVSDGDWEPADAGADPGHVLDRWAEARLAQTVAAVTDALDNFDALGGATTLAAFVDDLSNWYVRRSRPRFWGPAGGASDPAAFATLYRCLTVVSQLLAPFCPFLADELCVTLTGEMSVHVQRWPDLPDPDVADARCSPTWTPPAAWWAWAGRPAPTPASAPASPCGGPWCCTPAPTCPPRSWPSSPTSSTSRPSRTWRPCPTSCRGRSSPTSGPWGPARAPGQRGQAALAGADGSEIRRRLEADGFVEVAGERLEAGDVEVRASSHDQFALATDDDWAVALDLGLDDALELEGLARQLARDVNDLRRARGLSLSDRIEVVVEAAGPRLAAVLAAHGDWIAGQVLATSLVGERPAGRRHLRLGRRPRPHRPPGHLPDRLTPRRRRAAPAVSIGVIVVKRPRPAPITTLSVHESIGAEQSSWGRGRRGGRRGRRGGGGPGRRSRPCGGRWISAPGPPRSR